MDTPIVDMPEFDRNVVKINLEQAVKIARTCLPDYPTHQIDGVGFDLKPQQMRHPYQCHWTISYTMIDAHGKPLPIEPNHFSMYIDAETGEITYPWTL